jgi:hypothetical protein
MRVGPWGRVVLSSVVAVEVVGKIGLTGCCRKRCIVVENIVAEAVVGIGVALAGVVDDGRAVPGLSPCSIRRLP